VHPERDEACSVEEASVKPMRGYVSTRVGVAGSGGAEYATKKKSATYRIAKERASAYWLGIRQPD